jgi:hypothetical protein
MKRANRRAVLGGFVALGAVASSPSRANSIAAEDSEILALRVEFERAEAMRQPLIDQTNELAWTFTRIVCESGYETARVWGEQSGFSTLDSQLDELNSRANAIVESMISLRPKTLAGVGAVAATMKEDALNQYWDKPEEDRDFDVSLITRFLDGLIELGQMRGDADRVVANAREAAR